MPDENKLHELEIKVTKIETSVEHIKDRLDNGISQTMTKIWDEMNKRIIPAVEDSQFWIGHLKKFFFWGSTTLVVGSIVGIATYIIKINF